MPSTRDRRYRKPANTFMGNLELGGFAPSTTFLFWFWRPPSASPDISLAPYSTDGLGNEHDASGPPNPTFDCCSSPRTDKKGQQLIQSEEMKGKEKYRARK